MVGSISARIALASLLLGPSCVQLSWNRVSQNTPVVDVDDLVVGTTDLSACLGSFGAPIWVLELEDGRGAALVYTWLEEKGWGFRMSVPVSEYVAADFDYDKVDARTRGVILFFNEAWSLTAWRRGLLKDLAPELRRRRPVEIEES